VVIQIDGGHIPIKDKDKRSFEALSAMLIVQKTSAPLTSIIEIEDKSCALSARDDDLATMKITPSMRHASKE